MIDRTFQLVRGVGPGREKELWRNGIQTWADLPDQQITLSEKLDPQMREAIAQARAWLQAGDAAALCDLLPSRERWRLYPHFADEAAFLDIETEGTSDTAEITAIGVLWRGQVYSFVNGFNLEKFPELAEEMRVLVTFNGSCFDVPVIERYFRHLKLPKAHIDARFAARCAGMDFGLKRLEDELGLHRPLHLKGVSGYEAVVLWKAWRDTGNREALLKLVEYNLYDAIQLKPVMERIYNRMRDRQLSGAPELPQTERGDVLYDVTRVVASFAAPAPTEAA